MPTVFTRTNRRRAAIGVVGVVLVTAGCLGTPGSEVDDPEAVMDQVDARYEELEGFQATMIQTVETADETSQARATVTFDKEEFLKIAYHSGAKAGAVSMVEDPTEKLFGDRNADTANSQAETFYGTVAADLVRDRRIVFNGTERVDGRRTAVFSMTATADAAASAPERTVWIDTDRVVPLRIESQWVADGETVTETIRFEDVSLGSPDADATATRGVAT
jgi:outer membrane lipoprotein-sorting protein